MHLEAEFVGHQQDRVLVQALVDGHHDAEFHALLDDIRDVHLHQVREVVHGHELRDAEDALLAQSFLFLAQLLLLRVPSASVS